MATSEGLQEVQDAPQPQETVKRERSAILFPYQDLGDAIKVAKGVHTLGGSSCQTDQLAAQLGHTVTSGAFQQRLNTARIFGLLTNSKGMVTLTALGIQIVDPQQQKAAKVDSFLNVPLYKRVYEQFKGASLPPPSGLEATIASFGVAPKQKETARRVFQRSAELAGFFDIAKDRLTYPSLKGAAESTSTPSSVEDHGPIDVKKKTSNGGGGNGGDDDRHPLIDGLIKALPASGEQWPIDARRKWLQAAAMNFDYVYVDPVGGDIYSIKVTVEKDTSAN
jgi:hypothetical protein